MGYITRDQAFKALGQQLRKKYGFKHDESVLFTDGQVGELLKMEDETYKRYGSLLTGVRQTKPGGHSDYDYLKNSNAFEKGNIIAFYLDLKNFTKYCMLFPLERVYQVKAITIEAIINVCFAYDGHLHEIPGDGVLVFFGGKNKNDIACATSAILAACEGMYLLENHIIPEYNNETNYPDIYPKMGIDYGEALWGRYGTSGCYEVKATSFYVDIAAKMMKQCNSKQIAVGNGLKEFLKIDDKYLTKGEAYKKEGTIEGNKKTINYNIWLFDWGKFYNENTSGDDDLSKISFLKSNYKVGSKTKLNDAPLACD